MAEYGLYGAMVRHSLPLPETIANSAKEGADSAPWLLGMHRKSLEAAEHIRKQDENENILLNEGLSLTPPASSSSPESLTLSNKNENKKFIKSESKSDSVANLRAKAKEHSLKLIESQQNLQLNKNRTSYDESNSCGSLDGSI